MIFIFAILCVLTRVMGDGGATAECVFATVGTSPFGRVTIQQFDTFVQVSGGVMGLVDGKHGFHVHTSGNITASEKTAPNCTAAGGHFNPTNTSHGGPMAAVRHAGDWGNVVAVGGAANINFTDSVAKLSDIVGRAIVLHADEDDLGLGGFNDSKTTGHAGARLACCRIALLSAPSPSPSPAGGNTLFGLQMEIVFGVLGGAVVLAAVLGVGLRYGCRAWRKRRGADNFQKF